MTSPNPPVLEFPEMLHGLTGAVRRKVDAQGKAWAREYLETGGFTQPRRMLPVPPGELLEVRAGMLFDADPQARWRVHMFSSFFMNFNEGLPEQERPRAKELLDSFCLNTPWGALIHAASLSPSRSAERMTQRLAALLRFWEVLQGPRYAFLPYVTQTLAELMESIYRETLDAWCPRRPVSVRDHLSVVVERMAHATREECLEAVIRVVPVLLTMSPVFKHRAVLGDPVFLRERLRALPAGDFDKISSADKYAVTALLIQWEQELGQN